MIKIYAAGTSGKCFELPGRFSDTSDVIALYIRFSERFPRLSAIISQVAHQNADAAAVLEFIDQTYRIADPSLTSIPPETDIGYDSWFPRRRERSMKYWDRVPLYSMRDVGYFNCLYATALTACALSEVGYQFTIMLCPGVPTHPYIGLAGKPDKIFSFHHDGLRQYDGPVEIGSNLYTQESLIPISDYGLKDGIYGLSIPEHFIIPTRLVPVVDNIERTITAFADLAASLDSFSRLEFLAGVIRLAIIPRLRSGPIPFTRTIETSAG
ncbi:MAG TPA: hypothetical protein VNF47_21105 [Streptosporangiaceae bacterium]|nr:hypothetical protein [Streptosporangiaceae bacterium]